MSVVIDKLLGKPLMHSHTGEYDTRYDFKTTITVGTENADYITDGTADEVQINSAIDAITALTNGGRVLLLNQTYNISDNIILKANVTLEGQGFGSHLKLVDSATLTAAGIIRVKFTTRPNNATVRNLQIDGNKANNATVTNKYGVYSEADNLTMEGLWVHDCPAYGLDPHEDAATATPSKYLKIINNYIYNNGDKTAGDYDGITLDNVQYSTVSGNVTYGNGRHGINVVTAGKWVTIANNVSYDNGDNGITIQNGSQNLAINANIIHSNGLEGIYNIGSDSNTIVGNHVYLNQNHGIRLRNSSYCTVSSNIVLNNSQSSNNGYEEIGLDSSTGDETTYNIITGNNVLCNETNKGKYGIDESSTREDYNTYVGNIVNGAVTGNQRVQGTNSVKIENTDLFSISGLLNQTPTTETITPDNTIIISIGGSNYKIPVLAI